MADETMVEAKTAAELVERIKPLLAGEGPGVQGAVLLDLVSIWLACHHPDIRGDVFREWLRVLPSMTKISEKMLFGEEGFPTGEAKP